jgi:Right handed beta helix region
MTRFRLLSVAVLSLLARPLLATDYYAASNGSSSGNGSRDKPWDLATALSQPTSVKPGDTIWLKGGTYVGHFTSKLKGSPDKPIMVRQPAGERATLDGNDGANAPVTLMVNGSDTWFWGFEITNSNATRATNNPSPPAGRGEAVNLLGPRTRLINMTLHDTNQGVLTTSDIADTEVTGCVIYDNGYDGSDRGHGHGIYIQNSAPSTKVVRDNIIFDQFGIGIHGYTVAGRLDNLVIEGNTLFDNGLLSHVSGPTVNILVGASGAPAANADDSAKVARNATIRNNYSYFSSSGGTAANLGYNKGIAAPTILDNYLAGGTALALINAFPPITMTGNTFYGSVSGFQSPEFPNNSYLSGRPAGVKIFVRPNKYDAGRANITIYNWDKVPAVDVDVHEAMTPGAHYELRQAQNFFGAPVLSGVYDGSPLHVPMAGSSPAAPVGWPVAPVTGPDFQVFVLMPTGPPAAARGQ